MLSLTVVDFHKRGQDTDRKDHKLFLVRGVNFLHHFQGEKDADADLMVDCLFKK